MTSAIEEATAIYAVSASSTVTWHTVDHDLLAEYSAAVAELQRSLIDLREDALWQEIISATRRIRSSLSATPLPFSHPAFGVGDLIQSLDANVRAAERSADPTIVKLLREVIDLGQALARCKDDPLGDAVIEVTDPYVKGVRGLVIPTPRYRGSVEDQLKSRPMGTWISVHTPASLRQAVPLDGLAVTGSTAWYRRTEFVCTSPRARNVVLLRWAWVTDRLPSARTFVDSRVGRVREPKVSVREGAPRRGRVLTSGDTASTLDWQSVATRVAGADAEQETRTTIARLVLLADGAAVALNASAEATVHILEPDLVGAKRVQEIPTAELGEGDFVLLRTQGGGDLVEELANESLGAAAPALRAKQQIWKQALEEFVDGKPSAAARKLQKAGLQRATYMNLRNWMSPRLLRTLDPNDWAVLMAQIGLADHAQDLWDSMGRLRVAHQGAGHTIRRLLTDVVAEADLTELETDGVMSFELAAEAGGSLTAFRVETVSPDDAEVPDHRLGRRINAEDLWLG